MPLKILVDEDVHQEIIKNLFKNNIELILIRENHNGFSDKEILELSVNEKALILTEDKDFGEWIFAYKEKSIGIIFLRYESKDINKIIDSLLYVITNKGNYLYQKFTVITPKKLRTRDII